MSLAAPISCVEGAHIMDAVKKNSAEDIDM